MNTKTWVAAFIMVASVVVVGYSHVPQAQTNTGSISGIIMPPMAHARVWTLVNADTLSSQADEMTGAFNLDNIPQGIYTLNINAQSPYTDTTIVGVAVTGRQSTDIGTITLKQ